MSSVLPSRTALGDARSLVAGYWPVVIGLAVLYLPTYWDLAHSLWQTEEEGHGPIVLAVAAFLFWRERERLAAMRSQPRALAGGALLAVGLVLYVLGRSQDIPLFEVGSQIPVMAGVLLITLGTAALRAMWFPILFLAFMVPLPGILIDALTGPMKQGVSAAVEQALYAAGYPIARSGVILNIGKYQLLVADACSGLNSLVSLTALGLVYLYLMRHASWTRTLVLVAVILPIAISANIVRTMVLVLVTYHFGDEAGQGFLHGAAGMLLFVAALLLIFALDGLLGLFFRDPPRPAVLRPGGERGENGTG